MDQSNVAITGGSIVIPSLTSSGATFTTGIISPAQITADTNDYAPTGLATSTILRINTDATRKLTGLTAYSGKIVTIINIGSFPLGLVAESASSTAANRFALDYDKYIRPNQTITLWYDVTSARWKSFTHKDSTAFQTLTDAATIAYDTAVKGLQVKVILGGNRTLGAPTNLIEGETYIILPIQDATGSRTLTYNACWSFGGDGAPTLSTGANKIDMIVATCLNATSGSESLFCTFKKAL